MNPNVECRIAMFFVFAIIAATAFAIITSY